MDNMQSNIFTASQRLNDLTGYTGIEELKKEIEGQEATVQSTRQAVKDGRAKYAAAVATRSRTQREVNDLLQRKHAWTPGDLERFTSLYRSDHANEQAEAAAQDDLGNAEREAEEASTRLARTILARYHEEQIWSDKIRQMSTWGTWGLMGLNVLLFIVFQVAIEPWRRRRLVRGFEEKVLQALEREGAAVAELNMMTTATAVDQAAPVDEVRVGGGLTATQSEIEAAIDTVEEAETTASLLLASEEEAAAAHNIKGPSSTKDPLLPPRAEMLSSSSFAEPASGYAYYEEAFRELFSDRKVVVTQKELTAVALEGAAGGAAVMGLLLVLLRPR